MRMLFEQFVSSEEDWMKSAIVCNIRQRKKGSRRGQYVWKKFEQLRKEPLVENNKFKVVYM